ncbi:hypothetical protein SAY87_015154 [Trapa incisa]|uniref:Uncharacterized protein n=1 Tax=Trapa incisa TaxID=236973 RepID=A0AAN7JM43_9MYRT|nr:hypothetical protein SAY87_015154 [Trapa incisa]
MLFTITGPERAARDCLDGRWKLQQDLFSSDVGTNWGHLQLEKAHAEAHILTVMDAEMVAALGTLERPGCVTVHLVAAPIRLVQL